MYNNKQDFVPPLVDYRIVYLTNAESFLYFLIKLMGSLVIILLKSYNIWKMACTKDFCQQTILYDAFSAVIFKYNIVVLHHTDLLLSSQQSLVK